MNARGTDVDRNPIDIIDGMPPGDLLLVCSDGQSIRVHSQIIMLASSVLRQTLSSTLKVRDLYHRYSKRKSGFRYYSWLPSKDL